MPLHIYIRRSLFFLAIIGFFVIAPLVVLYAYGFRWDFEQKRIVQVGMITVKCIPKTVNIFVNDKLKARQTYARIKDLTPKEYQVKIQKNGYITWEKKLTVEPKKVTAIKHARLFLQEPKISQLTDSGIDDYLLSPDGKKIVYSVSDNDKTGLWLLDLASGNTSKLFPKSKEEFLKVQENLTFYDLKWSFDSEKVLALYKTGMNAELSQTYHIVINIARPQKIVFLEDLFKLEIKDTRWHPKNSNEIFWLNQENLYKFTLDQKTLSSMLALDVLDYALVNQDVYYINKTEDIQNTKPTFKLIKKNLSSLEEKVITDVSDLGAEEFSEILAGERRQALKLGKDKALYILDKENKLQKIADKTQKVIWDDLQNKLLYQNDYEIFVVRFFDEDFEVELEKPQQELITRYSEKIQDCTWYPSYQHIIFSVKNTIKIIELDGRDKRNVYEFGEIKTLYPNLSCDLQGQMVYFLNKKDEVKNIFQAEIY